MPICKGRVGKGSVTFQCSVPYPDHRAAHIGPCAAAEIPHTQVMRDQWLRENKDLIDEYIQPFIPSIADEPKRVVDLYSDPASITEHPQIARIAAQEAAERPLTLVGDDGDPNRLSRSSDSQPLPTLNDGPSAHEQVIADTTERMHHGTLKYGTSLGPLNGRDSAKDAYEEVLDLAAYLANLTLETAMVRSEMAAIRELMSANGRLDGVLLGIARFEALCERLGI